MKLLRRIAAVIWKPAQPQAVRPPAPRRPTPVVLAPLEAEEDDYRRAAYN